MEDGVILMGFLMTILMKFETHLLHDVLDSSRWPTPTILSIKVPTPNWRMGYLDRVPYYQSWWNLKHSCFMMFLTHQDDQLQPVCPSRIQLQEGGWGPMVISWSSHGHSMAIHGHLLAHNMINPWSSHGHIMVILWPSYGHHMVIFWSSHGYFVVIPWSFYDHTMVVPMVIRWSSYGQPIVTPSSPHGHLTVISWTFYGHHMVIFWSSHSYFVVMVILWSYHGCSMVIPWSSWMVSWSDRHHW